MTAHFWKNESAFFWEALVISFFLHGSIAFFGKDKPSFFHSQDTVEIDLTHAARISGLTTPEKPARRAVPQKPEEWRLPKKNQNVVTPSVPKEVEPPKTEERPVPDANIPAGAEASDGTVGGDGLLGVANISRYPQLMNLVGLQANLRRFYPESERIKRNEGNVTLELRVSADGSVTSAEVVRSAGPAFDEAAKRVALLLKFKPAMVGREKVAVKLRQTIGFKLEQ